MKKKLFVLAAIIGIILLVLTLFLHFKKNKSGLVLKEKIQLENIEKLVLHSKLLDKEMKVNVFLPNGYNEEISYPVLYILHGFSGNADSWFSSMEIHNKAQMLIDEGKIEPLIIVSPQMDNSYGINSAKKYEEIPIIEWGKPSKVHLGMYEDYLYKEVISYIDKSYSTISEKESRYIGGLSMGGYIALRTAFRHQDLFSKVGGHSPGIYLEDQFSDPQFKNWLYPNEQARIEGDPLYMAKSKDLSSLEIYLDCGDDDLFRFYLGCEELFNTLSEKGVSAQYNLNSGGHDINYWTNHTEDYLLFYGAKK